MKDVGPILDKLKNLEREVFALSTVNGIQSQKLVDKDGEISSLITTIESLHDEAAKQVQTINLLKEHLSTSEQECGVKDELLSQQDLKIESQKEEIERLTEMKIQRIEIENGAINFSIQGEAGMSFAAILLRFFEDNGGKNFFTFDVDKNEMRFSITIENKNGELTVTEKLNRQFKEIESLKAITELAVKGLKEIKPVIKWKTQLCDADCICPFCDSMLVINLTLSEIQRLQNDAIS